MPSAIDVILIDDDEDFCDSARSFFAAKAIRLHTLSSPQIAAAMDFSQIRVVLLDIDMPGLSGIDLLERIRRSGNPVVIMVSGHSDAQTRVACLSGGADFFFSKPVHLEELSLVVTRALGRAGDSGARAANWALKRSSLQLESPDGRAIGLSSSEYRLLELLISRGPNEATRDELSMAMTGQSASASSARALEVMLSRIRSRANSDTVKLPVKSLRNIGYIFHGNGRVID